MLDRSRGIEFLASVSVSLGRVTRALDRAGLSVGTCVRLMCGGVGEGGPGGNLFIEGELHAQYIMGRA